MSLLLALTDTGGGGVTGTVATRQAQTIAASASVAVSGVVSTSQAQTVAGDGSFVDSSIQMVHGYNFEHDRRLLKARRDKEEYNKQSFAEQLAEIKPKVVKSDKAAAAEFVQRISDLVPVALVTSVNTKIDYPIRIDYVSDDGDDEAIALIMAALL